MRIIRLRLLSTGEYRIVVHLDTTKVDEGGQPDPEYVLDLRWPPRPQGMTHAEYLQQERPVIRARCQSALAYTHYTEGAALPGEGDVL